MMSPGEQGQTEPVTDISPVSYRQLRAKQVEVLFDQVQVAISATIAAALIMVGMLWGLVPQLTLLTWLAVFALHTALRWGTQNRFKRSDKTRNTDFWLAIFLFEACSSGVIWGTAILFLTPEGSLLYLGFIVLWVCGLCAGAIASLSVHRGAFFVFTLPALLPAAVDLLLSNVKEEVTIGAGILIYLGFISLNSQRMHQTLMQSLKFQFNNEQLIHHLDAERERVERLNDRLETKVVIRTADLSRVNRRLQKEVKERKRVEHALRIHVRYLENMNQITMAMGETFDPDELLVRLVTKTRKILKAERAWLLHPCDTQSKTCKISVESTAEAFPALFSVGEEMLTDLEVGERLSQALETNLPVVQHRLDEPIALERRFSVRSQMFIALRPQFGQPWLLAVHQCSHERRWSDEEQRLFKDIAMRLIDLLSATNLQRELKQSEERLRLALESARVGLWDWDIRSGETYFNLLWQSQIGFDPGEIESHIRSWRSRIHPDDSAVVLRELDEYLDGTKAYFETEYRLRTKDGQWVWVQTRGEVVERSALGQPLRAVGTQIDISQRKRVEEKLKLDAVVFENTSEGVIITDANFHILAVNRAFTEITGYSSSEVLGNTHELLHVLNIDDLHYADLRASLSQRGCWQGEILNQRKNGERYPQWTNISQVKDTTGSVSHFVIVFSDITALKDSQIRLEHLAHHDSLTNLPNRLLFSIRLEHALERSRREGGKVAVLFLDLDRFKHVNDNLGHQAGDELLVQVSERLKEVVRAEDTVARQSGDEFMILLEGLVKSGAAGTVAAKATGALGQAFNLGGKTVYITGSVGISLFPDDADGAETLHRNADIALYRAKELGRNNYQFYTKELTIAVAKRTLLESNLRNAIENDEFELFFQPQLSINNQEVMGVEALLRWRHPKLGLLLPSRFLPLAEETGLIFQIGAWALRNACAQISNWNEELDACMGISVNISQQQLQRGDVPEQVEQLLLEFALSPSTLELEFTEGLFVEQSAQITQILKSLRTLGVSLAIDDFGKGYSSLSFHRYFRPNTLKIDRSFIRNISQHPDDLAVVGTIATLAKRLNLKVVAEGVETEEQLRLLRRQHCDLAQGYLFSAPLSAIEFSKFIDRNHLRVHQD